MYMIHINGEYIHDLIFFSRNTIHSSILQKVSSHEDTVQTNIINEESSDDLNANGVDSDSNHTQTGSHAPETESSQKTSLPPGRVLRRKKQSRHHSQRASFPQACLHLSESKSAQLLENKFHNLSISQEDEDIDTSSSRLEGIYDSVFRENCVNFKPNKKYFDVNLRI